MECDYIGPVGVTRAGAVQLYIVLNLVEILHPVVMTGSNCQRHSDLTGKIIVLLHLGRLNSSSKGLHHSNIPVRQPLI
jgi:hypothetical protein